MNANEWNRAGLSENGIDERLAAGSATRAAAKLRRIASLAPMEVHPAYVRKVQAEALGELRTALNRMERVEREVAAAQAKHEEEHAS